MRKLFQKLITKITNSSESNPCPSTFEQFPTPLASEGVVRFASPKLDYVVLEKTFNQAFQALRTKLFLLTTKKKLFRDNVFDKLWHGTQFDIALGNHALRAEPTDQSVPASQKRALRIMYFAERHDDAIPLSFQANSF